MPNHVKKRWIARQIKNGNPKFVEPEVEVVEEVVEEKPKKEKKTKKAKKEEKVVEPTVVEGGSVTDVEVVDEKKEDKE